MNKFSYILESIKLDKSYQIKSEIIINVKSVDSGSAGYTAESIFSSMPIISNYNIIDISESFLENKKFYNFDRKRSELLKEFWDNEFLDKEPLLSEKMEWYFSMRNMGFDKYSINKFLNQ